MVATIPPLANCHSSKKHNLVRHSSDHLYNRGDANSFMDDVCNLIKSCPTGFWLLLWPGKCSEADFESQPNVRLGIFLFTG